jgi:glycerophosphoryl diester phosphodiesterase
MNKLFGRWMRVFLPLAMLTGYGSVLVQAEEPTEIVLSNERYAILADVDDVIDLSSYFYMIEGTKTSFSQLTFNQIPVGVTATTTTITASTKGVFHMTVAKDLGDPNPLVLITKLSSDTEYVLYEEDFSGYGNGPIPDSFTQVRGTFTDQSAYIDNGRLILDARVGEGLPGLTTQVLLPSYLGSFGNYVIESDFTILATSSGSLDANTRWGSIMYRYAANEEYYQMAIRKNASANNGVEVAQWDKNKNPWTWTVFATGAYSENIDPSKMYRVKIDLKGSEVVQTIDGYQAVNYDFLTYLKYGRIGLQATQQAMTAHDNFKITLPVTHVEDISVQYTSIPALYNHPTGIINPGPVAQIVNHSDDINDLTDEIRPQIGVATISKVGDELHVVDPNHQSLMTIGQFMRQSDNTFIPAFYPKTLSDATDIANFLKEFLIVDSFIISEDPQAILDAKAIHPIVKGILIHEDDPTITTITDNDLIEIRNRTNIAKATVAVIPNRYATKANVEFLQTRLITAWVNVTDLNLISVTNAVLSGANGFYTNNFETIYQSYDLFPERSLVRRPLIIGHRGIPSLAPENSRGGFIRAYEEGADIIELDIFLSSDNEIVVIHDSTTTRTAIGNVNYPVESTSYNSVLKNILLKPDAANQYTSEFLPTLGQVFDDFQYRDAVIFVEIKSSRDAIIPALKNLIEEKNISSKVVVISFSANTLAKVVEQIPEVSVGNLSAAASANINGAIENGIYATVPNRTTFNSNFGNLSKTLINQLHYRGITTWPWTLNTEERVFDYYGFGVGGITTDYAQFTKEELNRFSLNERFINIDLNDPFISIAIRGAVRSQSDFGFNQIAPSSLTVLDAGTTGITLTGANITQVSATGKAYLLASYSSEFKNTVTYNLFDQLIEVEVVNTYVDPGDTSSSSSSQSTSSTTSSSTGTSSEQEQDGVYPTFITILALIGGGLAIGIGGWFYYAKFISKK